MFKVLVSKVSSLCFRKCTFIHFDCIGAIIYCFGVPGFDGGRCDIDIKSCFNRFIDCRVSVYGENNIETLRALVVYYFMLVCLEQGGAQQVLSELHTRILHLGSRLYGREVTALMLRMQYSRLYDRLMCSEFKSGVLLSQTIEVWKSLVVTAGRYHPFTLECVAMIASQQFFRSPNFQVSDCCVVVSRCTVCAYNNLLSRAYCHLKSFCCDYYTMQD
jgi:hypothetical protein